MKVYSETDNTNHREPLQVAESGKVKRPKPAKTDYKFIAKVRENRHYEPGNGQSMSWYHFKAGPDQSKYQI